MQSVGNVTTIGRGARTEIKYVLGDAEDQKHRTYRRWLAPWLSDDKDGSQTQLLSSLRRNAAGGTGTWLVENFLPDWLKKGTDHLCLHGSVGMGKSTFALAIQASYFTNDIEGSILAVPALFAFDRRYTHGPDFLLRTILAQFCSLRFIPPGIEEEYKRHAEASEIRQVLDLTCSVIQGLDEDALELHEHGMTHRTSPLSLNLILDALDEVPPREQRLVRDVIDRLSALNSTLKHVRVRIIMFVRSDTSVHTRCQESHIWSTRQIYKDDVDIDIHTAVWMRLSSHPSLKDLSHVELKQVVHTIVTRVDGMFRLAALYCDELEKLQRQMTKANEVLDLVNSLPDELHTFYDRILESVSDKALRPYLTRTLCLLAVVDAVPATYLAALSSMTYKSWYSWFGNFAEKPIKSDDILVPLNGLVTKELDKIFDYRGPQIFTRVETVVKLAHFSVAEYLRLANTRKALENYDFASSVIHGSGNRAVGLRLYAFRTYGSLFPDYLQTDDLRTAWEHSHDGVEINLKASLVVPLGLNTIESFHAGRWLWRIHHLLFDIIVNIVCVLSIHPKRCWSLRSRAPFSIDMRILDLSLVCAWWAISAYAVLEVLFRPATLLRPAAITIQSQQ
ncbi:hypothetical protein FKW77_007688 [Venturia effusa]|uniref:Nephrocystin 3-like N-terminal domain-containing protein n=1 Tax=Venturia effusa TaxID=50376 RepID=A0A517LHL7_9PEZI|nr:hypothetical protein FKW77_007688 [Venturia effusa]